MSLLAVTVQFYGQAEVVATLKAGAFWPRPEVDSAVVCINLSSRTQPAAVGTVASGWPMVDDEEAFFRLVKAGFSQKRKQLKNNLRTLSHKPDEIEAALTKAGVDGRRRAETLSLAEWVAAYQAF
jgi:16S rRNA (adenine1518-N6/adenine1519-N6)-dimethyltransferase